MIIIKMSILYFIQIRRTEDFTSTGTRLVFNNDPRNLMRSCDRQTVAKVL